MQHNYFLLRARTVVVALAAVSLFFVSCSKGDAGPEGPEGPAGPQGPQGTPGPAGTANVIYSNWLDVTFTEDEDDQGNPTGTYYAEINAAKLTNEILSRGDMKVYINLGSAAEPYIAPLPMSDPFYDVHCSAEFLLQKIFLYADTDLSTVTEQGVKYLQFRYILIPGGTGARVAQPDWKDYNKVKEFYGLPD